MSIYQQISASSLKTDELRVSLPGVTLKQSNILFDGNFSLSFANILSGISDVQSKNYSNFYLTTVEQFDDVVNVPVNDIKPKKIVTTLQTGSNFAAYPISTPVFDRYSTQLEIGFDVLSSIAIKSQFVINFIDSKYCTVSWDDGISISYLVVDGISCKLKRAPLISGTEHYLNYILNGSKLVLLKTISGNTLILTNNSGKLSAVNYSHFLTRNLKVNAFTIDNKIDVSLPSIVDQQYIDYTDTGLDVSLNNRIDNISNNFLLSRNHTDASLYDVMILKNHTNEVGEVGLFNTLGLSGSDAAINYRVYTSINSNINQLEDNTLSLSYVCYNQSFNIQPGLNTFKTAETMFPFSVLNINDTTFVNNGSFGSTTPKYADKVYNQTTNNIGENASYLCTWLSYDSATNKNIWLDRYYYPNLTTKENTLTAAIYNSTFDSYIEQLIASNQGIIQSLSANQYFDKISDFAFRPNETYVYDRIDIDNVDFFTSKNDIDAQKGYYSQINKNGGFTLSFFINQYTSPEFITISNKFNDIEGGLFVRYNNEELVVSIVLYDSVTGEYRNISSGTITLPARTKNSIVCHYDSQLGVIKAYLNEDIVVDSAIEPLQYKTIVYGDFVVQDEPLTSTSIYISNVFLSLAPVTSEELSLLVAKYNIIYNTFSISLPCGMRNRVDTVKHINALNSNEFSKSNAVDIYLDGLEISDDEKNLLKDTIKAELANNLPLNATINNIEFL
jgi:hypothetical protein